MNEQKSSFVEIRNEIFCLLEKNGIMATITEDDVDLTEFLFDSITFISFVMDIEQRFSIVVPAEYFSIQLLESINGLTNLISELISNDEVKGGETV